MASVVHDGFKFCHCPPRAFQSLLIYLQTFAVNDQVYDTVAQIKHTCMYNSVGKTGKKRSSLILNEYVES